ncbi:hypothetical protein SAURM35S_06319 [Streptomyces aurantiogriseus]
MDRATTNAPTSDTPSTSRISAPEMIASRSDSERSSRAVCSMSSSSVVSMLVICRILVELASNQSWYDRWSSEVRPLAELSARLA